MSRIEVKNKLKGIIRSMLLSDLEAKNDIPDAIAQEILKNYGCTVEGKSNEKHNLDGFLRDLQTWIENNHQQSDVIKVTDAKDINFDMVLYKKFMEAESEYCEVNLEVTKVLEDVLKQKEVYSQYFKDECNSQKTTMEVLSKKCQFLKLQFFLKLYGEENALEGHLALKAKLKKELNLLINKYSDLVEYNKQMSEIRSDKTFCELFKVYKELRRIEKMTEIIGTI